MCVCLYVYNYVCIYVCFYLSKYFSYFIQLFGWLEKKLPNEKKLPAELKDCIPPLYTSLEDRSPDVRKAAQAVVPCIMAHVGYDAMSKATGKLDVSISFLLVFTFFLFRF